MRGEVGGWLELLFLGVFFVVILAFSGSYSFLRLFFGGFTLLEWLFSLVGSACIGCWDDF